MRERFPERAPTIPEGDPEKAVMESYKADATKSERILGIKWTPIEHTVVDILIEYLVDSFLTPAFIGEFIALISDMATQLWKLQSEGK